MADLNANDVTVILTQDDYDRTPDRGIRTYPTISFGDGSKTYPSGGIPMPPIQRFGMNFEIRRVTIETPFSPYVFHYDRGHNKIRILLKATGGASGFTELGHVAVPATTLYLTVVGR